MAGVFTARNPHRVKRLFLMNTLLGYGGGQSAGGKTPWFRWIEKHEEAGTLNGILGEMGKYGIVGHENSWFSEYGCCG